MKKTAVISLLTAILCLAGCNSIEDAKETTVTIDKNGSVVQLVKEDFPSDQYDGEELTETVNQQLSEYNLDAGAENIILKSSEIAENKVTMLLEYVEDDDYRKFNNIDFYAGDVSTAVDEGYGFDGKFYTSQKKDVRIGTIPDVCMDDKVIIIKEPLTVQVPGELLYVSANMEIVDRTHVKMIVDEEDPYADTRAVTDAYGYVIYRP